MHADEGCFPGIDGGGLAGDLNGVELLVLAWRLFFYFGFDVGLAETTGLDAVSTLVGEEGEGGLEGQK